MVLFLLLLVFSSPALAQQVPPPVEQSRVYYCYQGKTFSARFQANAVELFIRGQPPQRLRLQPEAMETAYRNEQWTLVLNGNTAYLALGQKRLYDQCQDQRPVVNLDLRYDCPAQVAPFPDKENLSLVQAEKLRLKRDGALFIYHCYPRSR
ncbi:hypothetical protein OLK001_31180 [Synechocystis sp. LKSZ1]